MFLPGAIPYPEVPETGYWGTPTSTIDWCEENYVVSHYIAEIVNTTSNAAFIALAIYAFINAIRNKHERRFLIVSIGFITVGFGSWMFHMSLLYEYQLLDELPMIYATCVPYWVVSAHNKSRADSIKKGLQIAAGAFALTAIYLRFRDPTIHQAAYGILNALVLYKSVQLKNKYVLDERANKEFRKLITRGLVCIALGYTCWNVDINFCNVWRGARRAIGMPYGFILEGHGWWHLGTGLGVYHYIVYLQYLRIFILKKQNQYEFQWKMGWLPNLNLKDEFKNQPSNTNSAVKTK